MALQHSAAVKKQGSSGWRAAFSCDVPGVPFSELGGRQPSITWGNGGGERRAGHWEEKLETHKATSYHGQLSRLHHSPKHNGEKRRGEEGVGMHREWYTWTGSIDVCQSFWAVPEEKLRWQWERRETVVQPAHKEEEERERDRRKKYKLKTWAV